MLNLPLECLDNKLASLVVEILMMSSGVGQLSNSCLEVVPKVLQKSFLYSGKTLSNKPITCTFKEETLSTMFALKRVNCFKDNKFSSGNLDYIEKKTLK